MSVENSRTCPLCATAIPKGFPEGLCPRCMLAQAVPKKPADSADPAAVAEDMTLPVAAPSPSQAPARPTGIPSVEMLRALFPDLDILDLLGAGGMGAVYRARQPRLNRLVALKIMVCPPGHEADFALRFEREAQVLARLNHPHIVIIYDFGDLPPERTGGDPIFWFLMEHVDGTDLAHLIRSHELKPAQALAIVPQICDALQYAHDQGITHRDIKPANILLDKRGTVKIADFGLAKMIGHAAEEAMMTGLTRTGTAMGTPHYMAPEQWEDPQHVDHRADIYALGVVFYEMLTGERPAGVFEPPSKKSTPPVDRKLDGVVLRAMEKSPERRYQHAAEIKDDVARITGANRRKTPAPGSPQAAPATGRRNALLALGTAAALAVGGWMFWPEEEQKKSGAGSEDGVAVTSSDALSFGGHRYQLVTTDCTWDEAKAQAEARGGHLATFTTEEEERWARDNLFKLLTAQENLADDAPEQLYWIGAFAESGSRDYRWISGEAVGKINWRSGNPRWREEATSKQTKEAGVLFAAGLVVERPRSNGEWINVQLQTRQRQGFIIEWDDASGRAVAPAAAATGMTGASSANATLAGASAPSFKPGRLRAAGTLAEGRAHDLSKFAAYDDFVDVVGGRSVFVALRAGGEALSSDGMLDRKGVRSLAKSFGDGFGFVFEDGGAEVFRDQETTKIEPAGGDPITAVVIGSQHGLVLGASGTARVFGKRYEAACGDGKNLPTGYDTPKWPQPPAAALQNVRQIAVSTTHAATLHMDGTLSLWNWTGEVKPPPAPDLAAITHIASSEDAIWLLDARQQVWLLNLPRNTHPDQPIKPAYAFLRSGGGHSDPTYIRKPGLASAVGDKRWLTPDGVWRSEVKKLDDLMTANRISGTSRFDGLNGLYEGKLFASLLWIEPVEKTGGAAAPPAAATGMTGASSANAALAGASALPSASALPVKPGRLRGSGFHLDGKPLDLKKAEGITDFVQVILTDRGWVGLRATGDQVTPEEGWGEKNIARLLPAWFNSYGTINREGRLSIRRETSEGVKAIPDEVQRIGVVDACWDGGQAIALLKDGSARVWGEHYAAGYQSQPVWPAPPAEALQNVRKIAITHWRAATLRHDGKWHIWGGHGGTGPFDLADFQQWGEIADIATTFEPFRVLARDGKLYNLGGSRPLSGGLVTEGVEAVSDHLLKRRGAAVWSWHGQSRANAQPEVDALLKQIGDRPREAFDIRIVGDLNASNVAAVWIEPVE